MRKISLLDTSTFESHMDGLVGIMAIFAIAKRDNLYRQAWKEIVGLVNTRDDLTLEEKMKVLEEAEERLEGSVSGFVKSRIEKGYFKLDNPAIERDVDLTVAFTVPNTKVNGLLPEQL
tara:strand:+ start:1732 stop:2085 length:354 start_codon:yes stop_codon:yes gene_type:complete